MKLQKSLEKHRLLEVSKFPQASPLRRPPPPASPLTRSRLGILLSIVIFLAIWQKTQGGTQKRLPDVYGLCARNGEAVIYTSEMDEPNVECVVVDGARIADTGSLESIRSKWGEKDTLGPTVRSPWSVKKTGLPITYLPKGSALTPGFVDSHAHTLEYGWSRQLPLLGSRSVGDIITLCEDYVKSHQKEIESGIWIEGMGWDQTLWEEKVFPTAADFEKSPILRGLKISLKRIDIHADWVSQAVLDMLIPTLPSHPSGGEIIRYPDGTPTGVFTDDAMFLIDDIRAPWTSSQMLEYLKIAVRDGIAKGLTGIHDARVPTEELAFYERMAGEGKLPIRFYLMVACPVKEEYCGNEVKMIHNAGDGKLNVRSVKLFGDGALGSWGAALLEPYSDRPDVRGVMRSSDDVWKPLIKKFVDNGWQVNAHAIGDRANHLILDAMEAALGGPGSNGTEHRLRLEHAQILTLEDLQRAVDLGVIASYQPTHATSDMWYAEERLGPERIKGAYAWRRYLDAGGRITLGSDFPVESIDPLKGFYSAIARRDEKGNSPMGPDGWYPDQKLTRMEALHGMTIDTAYASFQEHDLGSFKRGKRFDAVLWSQDLLKVNLDAVLHTKVLATLVDGRCVFGDVKKLR